MEPSGRNLDVFSNRSNRSTRFDLVIIGGGPSGLACALEAKRRGLD